MDIFKLVEFWSEEEIQAPLKGCTLHVKQATVGQTSKRNGRSRMQKDWSAMQQSAEELDEQIQNVQDNNSTGA